MIKHTNNLREQLKIFCDNNYWKEDSFKYIQGRHLQIPPDVAKQSFVTDALRLNSEAKNRALIVEEIKILNPKLVICVGKVAKNVVGMKYYKFDTKFHSVAFPTRRHEKTRDNTQYNELLELLNNLS